MNQALPPTYYPRKKRHDWYDYSNLGLLAATFVALVTYTAVTAWLGVETRHAANTADQQLIVARRTANQQLRAYMGVLDGELRCASCDQILKGTITNRPPGYRDTDELLITVKNGGQTPAYDVSVATGFQEMPYGQKLPAAFSYQLGPLPADAPPISHVMANPGDSGPVAIQLAPQIIDLFVRAQRHQTTLFIYGEVSYLDVFGCQRSMPLCAQYDPDAEKMNERFISCPEHNTPKEDKCGSD